MAKVKLLNFEVLSVDQELTQFATEKLPFSMRFQLSKIQEEVGKAVKLIREEQEKLQEKETFTNDEGKEEERLTESSIKAVTDLFNQEIELEYAPIKIKDIGESVTDKPYYLVFKFFV